MNPRTRSIATLSLATLAAVAITAHLTQQTAAQPSPTNPTHADEHHHHHNEHEKHRKTRYQRFSERTGTVLIREYFPLAGPAPTPTGTLNFEAISLTDTADNTSIWAFRVSFKTATTPARTHTATLDEEELNQLHNALRYYERNAKDIDRKARTYTEAVFQSVDDFRCGFYTDRDTTTLINRNPPTYFIEVDGQFIISRTELEALRINVERARDTIKDNRRR